MNIVETERLAMRPFREEDLDWLVGHRSTSDVSQFLGGLDLQTPEFVEKRLKFYMDSYAKLGFSMSVTSLRETGERIGVTGIQPLEKTGDVEVGYSFEKEHWGKGFATESAVGWLKFGFEEAGLERIVAVADPDNHGSIAVMKKIGMTFEDIAFSHGLKVVRHAVSKEVFYEILGKEL